MSAGAAQAERRPSMIAEHAPDAPPAVIELEAGLYLDSQDGSSMVGFPFVLGGGYRTSEHVELELEWPFTFLDLSADQGEGSSSLRSGNPFAAVYYVDRLSGGGYFRGGVGVGLPVASVDTGTLGSTLDDLLPLAIASGMQGEWDLWLYAPSRLTLAFPLQVEHKSGGLLVGADLGVGALFTTDEQTNPDHDVVLQAGGLLGAALDAAEIGLRLQVVFAATSESTDKAQVSLVPFIQGQVGRAGFLYLRFVMNLDEPLGAFRDGEGWIWGLYAGGGSRF